ncbi:MAG: DSD1 family PLP-dependent enzyme [Blastocatellia bacterium]|nr:DSD1 family PLP-dependent enzyme [Blastocatellia bacterium]
MKPSRRDVLRGGLGLTLAAVAPEMMIAMPRTGYSPAEVDHRLARGENLTKADLVTPALLLDLDLFEANVARLAAHARQTGIRLRPHGKTHKCVEIARRQAQAGAIGLSVATIREAEAMAAAGIRGLLITSELVGKPKIDRLVRLVRKAPDTLTVVDHFAHAAELSEAAAAARITLNVMLDVDPAGRRTGVPPGEPALALAEKLVKLPHLKLRGIHGYSGMSAHVNTFDARRAHSRKVMLPILETFAAMKKRGMPVEIMSGGSTGTYNIDTELEGMTELQCGSYVFMDIEYRNIGGRSGPSYDDFATALTVMATVISRNYDDRATVDAGIKAFAKDRKFDAEVKGVTGVGFAAGSDEHGTLLLNQPSREIRLGDRVEFIVPHCDPNLNLYDRIFCVRGERVVDVWRTIGRYGD